MSIKSICGNCHREMLSTNEVSVIYVGTSNNKKIISFVFLGNRYTCPNCETTTIITTGNPYTANDFSQKQLINFTYKVKETVDVIKLPRIIKKGECTDGFELKKFEERKKEIIKIMDNLQLEDLNEILLKMFHLV